MKTYLITSIMFHRPYTDSNGHYTYKNKWYKDQYPNMAASGQLVTDKKFKHKKD